VRSAPSMLAAARSRNLVTQLRRAPQRSPHDWHIPQLNRVLARSRNLVTHAVRGAGRGRTRDALLARPAHERRAPGRGSTRRSRDGPAKRLGWRPCSRACSRWPSNTVDAHGCEAQDRKRVRNTSTCAVRVAPSPLLDRVEQTNHIGRARTLQRSLKKTDINPEEDPSKTSIRRKRTTKNRHVHIG
jgi:hypothetical protein